MSAEVLREAAAAMRSDWPEAIDFDSDPEIPRFYAAVADLLDLAATHQPTPVVRPCILAVANAYLGRTS